MNSPAQKQRVIPKTAWFLAAIFYLAIGTVILVFGIGSDPQMSKWPLVGKLAFAYGFTLFLPALILLIGYVYGDAKRRGMRYVMWTLLAIFIPNAIGIILYFILRDPLPVACPSCGRLVKSSFTFCPYCSTSLQPTCPQCGFAVERGWRHCPKCGTQLPSQSMPATQS